MAVPKCKECKYMYGPKCPNRTYRRCEHPVITCRHIRGNEHSTSPKWCPLRDI